MASSSLTLSSLLLLLLLPLLASAKGGFNVELIHRDSPKSPLYDPSKPLAEQLREAARRSIARADHLHRSFSLAAASGDTYQSRVRPQYGTEYFMEVDVGTPAQKIFAVADTGSDLSWINCDPCIGCSSAFDPKKSSTYHRFSCKDSACTYIYNPSCGNDGSRCEYNIGYFDGSHTSGFLAAETFTFSILETGTYVLVNNMVFGCSHNTEIAHSPGIAALAGLSRGTLSMVSQLGSVIHKKFSYCLVPYFNNTASSRISFGFNALVAGQNVVSTPLIEGPTSNFYYVSLKSLTLDGQSIPVKSKHVIVDTGTTYTILDSATLQSLEDRLKNIIKLPTIPDPKGLFRLCFDSTSNPSIHLPKITFQFDGAAVQLDSSNVFVVLGSYTACLGIISNENADQLGIIGNIAQQNFQIGYDLENRMMSLAPADCTQL